MKTVVIFMLCWMLPIASPMESQESGTIDLNMANQSVDDKYSGCTNEMANKVVNEYFPSEMRNTSFQKAWTGANKTAQKKFDNRQDRNLTKDHIQAIVVYSKENPDVYTPFNAAVRDGRPNYTTPSFPYHALHFWLTSAVQILNPNKQCSTTYRRSNKRFTGEVNQEFRFGSFTSSSKRTDLYRFGKETCFQIQTCFGAYLKDYPDLGNYEQEVLIPPYEKFKIVLIITKRRIVRIRTKHRIVRIRTKRHKALADCKRIFVVKTTGDLSNLNCQAI